MATLVSPKHKVNLGNPDKVILIEIYKVSLPLMLENSEDRLTCWWANRTTVGCVLLTGRGGRG